jgi:hypothetical protein
VSLGTTSAEYLRSFSQNLASFPDITRQLKIKMLIEKVSEDSEALECQPPLTFFQRNASKKNTVAVNTMAAPEAMLR